MIVAIRWSLALLIVLSGCATPSGDASSGVRALKYRLEVAESGFALAHGETQFVEELFFPDHGVACSIVWGRLALELFEVPLRLRAFHTSRARLASATEVSEIVVPRDFAMAVVQLASEQVSLVKRAKDLGLLLREPE